MVSPVLNTPKNLFQRFVQRSQVLRSKPGLQSDARWGSHSVSRPVCLRSSLGFSLRKIESGVNAELRLPTPKKHMPRMAPPREAKPNVETAIGWCSFHEPVLFLFSVSVCHYSILAFYPSTVVLQVASMFCSGISSRQILRHQDLQSLPAKSKLESKWTFIQVKNNQNRFTMKYLGLRRF